MITIESLTAELAQANADKVTYSTCIRELEKSLAASDRELEGARHGLRIMTNERDVLVAKMAPDPLFEAMGLGDVAMPSVKHTKTAAALSETAASTVALGESVASQPAVPADPMDWPLPCDIKVGCGTHGKGTSLRSLVGRMQRLYDEVVAASPAPQGGLDLFVAASQQPAPVLSEPDHMPAYIALQKIIDYPAVSDDAAEMKLIAVDAMTSNAQPVQQRATLNDAVLSKLVRYNAVAVQNNGYEWGVEMISDSTNNGRFVEFDDVRAILAAAEAK